MTIRTLLCAGAQTNKTYLPGPQNLAFGTMEDRGYFGEVSSADLATSAEMATLVDLDSIGTLMNPAASWLKFAHKGKVLYIAKQPLRRGLTIAQYSGRGLIYGRDVTIKDIPFKVRFMTGGDADPATVGGGEWNDLMYPVCSARPAGQPIWANFSEATLMVSGADVGRATFCQELRSGSTFHIYRGYTSLQTFAAAVANSDMNNYGWRPVLEYTGSL